MFSGSIVLQIFDFYKPGEASLRGCSEEEVLLRFWNRRSRFSAVILAPPNPREFNTPTTGFLPATTSLRQHRRAASHSSPRTVFRSPSGKFKLFPSGALTQVLLRRAIAPFTTYPTHHTPPPSPPCLDQTTTEAQAPPRSLRELAKASISISRSPITTTRSSSRSSGQRL